MENKTTNKVKTFEVGIWWYELHGGTVTVKAETEEEAERIVEENFESYRSALSNSRDTFSDVGESGVDPAEEITIEETCKDEVYSERFNTDVYVVGTTGSYKKGNILELGRVVYKDYVEAESSYKYKFGRPHYTSGYSYYDLGACPNRERAEVLFNKGDLRTLLFKRLRQQSTKNNYDFANNIDSALSGNKHIIMLQMHKAEGQYKPRTIHIRAINIERYSYNIPYRLHLMDYSYLQFTSKEQFADTITMNKKIKGMNGEEFLLFLNTPEHLNLLERTIEELIIGK